MKLSEIKHLDSIEALTELFGRDCQYDIGGRGGYIKVDSERICSELSISPDGELPTCIGAGCNYLGGGLRGAIFSTGSSVDFATKGFNTSDTKKLEAFCGALEKAYNRAEGRDGEELPEEDENGDTNWEAKGTNLYRRAGTISAY